MIAVMPHYGFNFQWLLSHERSLLREPDERALAFLARAGFSFVRLPMNYRSWTTGTDYLHPDEQVWETIVRSVNTCREHGLHVSLNLHRAPGYCINRNDLEPHNLWVDAVAQDAFVFLWEEFARRFADVPATDLSFDLVNEPPALDVPGFGRASHEALMRRTIGAIRAVDASRPITIDGLDGGNLAIPELADTNVTQSGRGYQPYPVSHWGAEWWQGWRNGDGPHYPGCSYEGKRWNQATLRTFYEPWRSLEGEGVRIHIGEMGCYNQTPNADAMRWFRDLFDLYREYGWGYAMWNFEGPFGIVGHGRAGAPVEDLHGYRVDRDLLELMIETRVADG
jgi:endoglucanase